MTESLSPKDKGGFTTLATPMAHNNNNNNDDKSRDTTDHHPQNIVKRSSTSDGITQTRGI